MADEIPSVIVAPTIIIEGNENVVDELDSGVSGEHSGGNSGVSDNASSESISEAGGSDSISRSGDGAEHSISDQSGADRSGLSAASSDGSDAVEIARIEAERDVTIAVIDAEAEQARNEALTDATQPLSREEFEQCLTRLKEAEDRLASITATLISSNLQAQSETTMETPLTEEPESLETQPEQSLTPLSTPTPIDEIEMVALDAEREVEADLEKAKPRFIPI